MQVKYLLYVPRVCPVVELLRGGTSGLEVTTNVIIIRAGRRLGPAPLLIIERKPVADSTDVCHPKAGAFDSARTPRPPRLQRHCGGCCGPLLGTAVCQRFYG
jgi:hypothetical protein